MNIMSRYPGGQGMREKNVGRIVRIWRSHDGRMIFSLIAMIALILQYSGANWSLFGDMRFELKYPLGRMVEMLPLAICGFEMGRHKLFECLFLLLRPGLGMQG